MNDSADREEGHPPDEHLAGEQIPLPPPFIVDEVNDKCVSKKNLPPIPSFSKPLSGIPYHRDGDDNHGYNGCLCGLNGCLGGPNHHDETPSVPPVPKAEDEGSWLLRRAILRDQLRGEQVGEEDGDEGDKASSGNHTSKDDKHPAGHLDGHQQQVD